MKKGYIFKEVISLLKTRQKVSFLFILAILGITAVLSQLTPIAVGNLTDYVLKQGNIHFSSILPFLLFILLINVINEVLKVIRRLLVEDTATRLACHARGKAVLSLLRAPLFYFREHMSGNIHGRLNRSLEGTVRLIKLLFMDFAPAIASGVAAIVVIFIRLPMIAAIVVVLVIPIGMFVVYRQISTQKGIRVDLMEKKANMDGSVVELLGGIETIRALDGVNIEKSRIDKHSETLRKREMRHHMAMAKYDCLKFINEAAFTVLVIAISVYLAANGTISVGDILTTYLCFTQLTGPLRELHRILDELSESMVLAEDYFKILHIPADFSYDDSKQNDNAIPQNGSLSLSEVFFSYPEKPKENVIKGISFSLPQGAFLGIAGPSGCGKSSLIKIIDKLEKATGEITVGNVPIKNISRKALAETIAYIPQTPFIVADTIYNNICYGINYTVSIEDVKEAARKANIDEVIESLPGKYDFMLSEGGANLSGGQRQRIAIARLFLRKPKILILDEATSALDNTSEKKIMEEINLMKKEDGVTAIAIAHRLHTLKNCDEILVIDKGIVVQRGNYEQLLKSPGLFSDMQSGLVREN